MVHVIRPVGCLVPQPESTENGHPKYVHVAEDLATRIRAGEWAHGKVPTVRDIANLYEVSSFTATRALEVLRKRGLVVTRDRSGSYVSNGESSAEEPAPCKRWV